MRTVLRLAAAREGLGDDHAAAAAGTATRRHVRLVGCCRFRRFGHFRARWHGEQLPRSRDIGGAIAISEQSIVADAVEAAWQHVDQETAIHLPDVSAVWFLHGRKGRLVRDSIADSESFKPPTRVASIGMGGRLPSESVAGLRRNHWPLCVGLRISALDADENQIAARAIKLLLLTGARRNEVTQAKWDQVNWEQRTLLVPLSKMGRPRSIRLNSAALEILRATPRVDDNPFIFPSPTTGRPSPSLHFPRLRIRKRAD